MQALLQSSDQQSRVQRFLLDEAAALNDERYDEWMGLLTADFDYRMPAPCVRDDPTEPRYDEESLLAWESFNSLRLRFQRIGSEFAWADRPPPLLRRHLTSIRVVEDNAGQDDELVVASDVLVARSRRPDGTTLVSAGRVDRLRVVDGELRLARRRVYVDAVQPNVTEISIIF